MVRRICIGSKMAVKIQSIVSRFGSNALLSGVKCSAVCRLNDSGARYNNNESAGPDYGRNEVLVIYF